MTGLVILQHIIDILESNTELTEIVNNKIFVQIAEENTTFPFVVLKRDSLQVEYIKNNAVQDNVEISINIAATTYKQAVQIAELIRQKLELYTDTTIKQCRITNISEDFFENAFVQVLQFNIII